MKIQDLFLKPVDRPIEGVIKADDQRHLVTEVEEFVITREVGKGLDQFVERYLNETTANGVWISGFFGSGKSHLLKILSLLLDHRPLADGRHAKDIMLPRVEDEILKDNLIKAARIPAQSVLFNIDQKADHIGGDAMAPILEVFVKVLNDLRGYHGKQGHIAKFEHDLDRADQLASFKKTYQRVNDRSWETDRDVISTARRKAFAAAYAEHFKMSEAEGLEVLTKLRDDYRLDIETFAEQVRDYIDAQGKEFRLNFFVDEVGQFIGQNSKSMLNLQTVAETLATVCDGRAWVFVTSQADLRGIIGEFEKTQADQFSKIEARFKTRVNLTAADVVEVIGKRLLAKTEEEPACLTEIYDAEKENLATLFRFGDESLQFKPWRGSDEFCALYPFAPFHFHLFQRCVEQLSKHEIFAGRHTSVGQRSLLAVFQEVLKRMRSEQPGELATFDRLYEGIEAALRPDKITPILQAPTTIHSPFAIRVLKALFLLKWEKAFKATPRNIAILLIDRPTVDIAAHEKAVKDALELLAGQSYLQRNGDLYEFLTDTEKDVEVEIKNTEIEDSQVTKLLAEVLFVDLLRDPKIRFEANGQDYPYARRLDDQLVGKDAEVALNIITPDHPNHAEPAVLAAQNTGKSELLLVLPPDLRLIDEARHFLRTQKFIQQNTGGSNDETRRAILIERGQQNARRRTALQELCADLFSKAPIYLNGSKLDAVGYGEPKMRFHKSAQELIGFAFPNLRMLKGSYDETTLSKTLLEPDDLLTSGQMPVSEAEQEILTYVQRNQNEGERTSVEAMVRHFARRTYGWHALAVCTLIGRLFRMGKLELRASELLDARSALEHLKNTRQHGVVRVRLQEQFDATKVNALKRFHHEFFDRPNEGTDARSAGQLTNEALSGEAADLGVLLDQASRYPFLESLRPVRDQISTMAGKDYAYLLNHLGDFETSLLEAKDDLLDPIKTFMHGSQRKAYDEAVSFLREEEANFADLPAGDIQPLRDLAGAEAPFRGDVVPSAKAAVAKLRKKIAALLGEEGAAASTVLDEHASKLQSLPDFAKLTEANAGHVLLPIGEVRAAIASARFVTAIRDRLNRYRTQDYPAQLALLAHLAAPPPTKQDPGTGGSSKSDTPMPAYIPASALRPDCSLPFIGSEADLDQWLAALRTEAAKELKKGNRISL
jgi:energy-coupling factor transporter ATP-binding protein EcfA2